MLPTMDRGERTVDVVGAFAGRVTDALAGEASIRN